MLLARRSGPSRETSRPIAVNRRNRRAKAAGKMEPVNAFLEKRVATRHRLVVPPVVRRLEAVRERGEVREDHLPDNAIVQEHPQADGERLVVIVLADEHHAAGGIPRGEDRVVVGHPRKRGFLDQHVLARGEGFERQVEVKTRRHGDDHGVDARIRRSPTSSCRSCRRRRNAGGTRRPWPCCGWRNRRRSRLEGTAGPGYERR